MKQKLTQEQRAEIKSILTRNEITTAEMARQIGLAPPNIHKWYAGHNESQRIEAALTTKAKKLLDREKKTSAVA